MNRNLLLIEDEDRMREILVDYFKKEQFHIFEASNGREAMEIFEENNIHLVILDIMIPEIDGWAVCKRIRKESDVPVIMLTARSDEDDKLMGYELGADDYVTKPFSPKVLVAKSKMLLKRAEGNVGKDSSVLHCGGIEINKLSRAVKLDDVLVELAPKEYELLLYMMENKEMVLTREQILNHVWGYDYFGDLRTVDTHIKKIRSKLGEWSKHIGTITRVGYKFEVNK
ncbi:DNA-binding response OmpR family regulator [Anaerosolibacter carboniphilus]|uniref:Stage 0 sporulation protein A homolog n=1 Tax=Anaerosolibacter carboniphilus TaxID=1417629 RepID=A0A841KPC3_9FIRM|nr:response regulator transcription factor [Anaerosolibacter carboniphilus]MBB6215316.1 DNA-binding response OmpR family regulator [Anaerosolibacter carboniphilus]